MIKLVSGVDSNLIGSWNEGTIDVKDAQAFGNGPGISAVSAIIHEFEEQYAKQVLGIKSWSEAHDKFAIPAELAVAGAESRKSLKTTSPYVYVLSYEYETGDILYVVISVYPSLTVTRYGNAPYPSVCFPPFPY